MTVLYFSYSLCPEECLAHRRYTINIYFSGIRNFSLCPDFVHGLILLPRKSVPNLFFPLSVK